MGTLSVTHPGRPEAQACDAADLIRDARQRAALTQVELAVRAGVTQSVISTYENGRREPSFSALQRILIAAGFTVEIRLNPVPDVRDVRERLRLRRAELIAAFGVLGGRQVRVAADSTAGRHHDQAVRLMVDLDDGVGLFGLLRMQEAAERILAARVEVVASDGRSADAGWVLL